jgi:hypothetical protein
MVANGRRRDARDLSFPPHLQRDGRLCQRPYRRRGRGVRRPGFPPPVYSVYDGRKHAWVAVMGDGIDHFD